jgi:hypoxanthine phosphoribosyltransferase
MEEAIGTGLFRVLPAKVEERSSRPEADLAIPSFLLRRSSEVVRTQWLDFSTLGSAGGPGLLGKRILIVDEVDDR